MRRGQYGAGLDVMSDTISDRTLLRMEDSNLINAAIQKKFKSSIKKIVFLQSLYRGNKARKHFVFLKNKKIGSSKYFTLSEAYETISR